MSFILNPYRHVVAGEDFLDSVLDSTVADLDATISNSYSGSGQTWANLIASPADGAGQTDYDFFLGADGSASTDDPTHTGTPGNSAAYFEMDGGDFFSKIAAIAATPTIQTIPKDTSGVKWWVAIAFNTGPNWGNSGLWGNGQNTINDIGMAGRTTGSGGDDFDLRQVAGGSATAANHNNLIVGDTDYLIVASVDMQPTTNNVRFWLNNTTKTQVSKAWLSNTSNSDHQFLIGGFTNEGVPSTLMKNASRLYHWSMGNAFIDDSDVAAIFAHLATRHNRDYTL